MSPSEAIEDINIACTCSNPLIIQRICIQLYWIQPIKTMSLIVTFNFILGEIMFYNVGSVKNIIGSNFDCEKKLLWANLHFNN